ncbi:MAG: hypothetical protein FWE77_05790 [Clostridia bacterium]|nr:hypothetical protein [Clostridia bacterium]
MHARLREVWAGRRVALCGADAALLRWTRALLTALNADAHVPETAVGGWSGGALREAFSRHRAEVWICAGLPRAHSLAIAREALVLLADSLATAQAYGVRCVLLMLGDGAYRDDDAPWGCRESDPLGGRDADGFAQSCLRLLAEGFRAGHWGKALPVAIAHYSEGALTCGGTPGISPAQAWLNALTRGDAPPLPEQAMPFQHPLEVAGGALLAAGRLLSLPLHGGDTWNFGVPAQGWLSSRSAFLALAEAAGFAQAPHNTGGPAPRIPRLDSEKARRHLGWRTAYDAEATLRLLAAFDGQDAAYASQAEDYLMEISKPRA